VKQKRRSSIKPVKRYHYTLSQEMTKTSDCYTFYDINNDFSAKKATTTTKKNSFV